MRTSALLLAAALAVTACGFKGPLYLPDQKPAQTTAAPGKTAPAAPADAPAPTSRPNQTTPQ